MRSSTEDALKLLAADPNALFTKIMEHGSMSVEFINPGKLIDKHPIYRTNYM